MIGSNLPQRTLTAAASTRKLRSSFNRVGEGWQAQLWEIYRQLGPVHYGVGFKRNAAQKVTYFVAEKQEGNSEPIPTENAQAVETFERLGDFNELAGELVVHINVPGEGWLVGQDQKDKWDVWSTAEVNAARTPGTRKPDEPEPLTDDDVLIRIWRPDPEDHSKPDSPLRSVQAQCEQLLLLNEQIGATAMSRLPAGILLVPDELTFAANAELGTGANADDDPFTADLINILTTAVRDSSSASRIAPGVVRGPSEYLKDFRILDFSREMDETFAEMREELLRMIAAGIDLPPEILLGKADLNHWSSWDVDESAAKLHVDPDVLLIISAVTQQYLWPMLEEQGVTNARDYMIWRDYSDLTSRPLTVEQGIKLREIGTVSDRYLRELANVPEDGAGDGKPLRSPQLDSPAGPENVDRTPPMVAAGGISLEPLALIDQALAAKIIEASEAAFTRAMEIAGARIRRKVQKDRDASALIDGIQNYDVAKTIGRRRVERFQLTEDLLLPADTFEGLEKRINQLFARAEGEVVEELYRFAEFVYPKEQAEEDRRSAVAAFITALFAAASLRLFNDSPQPDPAEAGEFGDEIATGQMVYELLTRAGGAPITDFQPDTPRGFALGQRTRAILRDHGYIVESETWNYGDKSLRRYPFEPHVNLNGAVVSDREDPRLNGYYPGDHRFCRCTWVPTVLPTS